MEKHLFYESAEPSLGLELETELIALVPALRLKIRRRVLLVGDASRKNLSAIFAERGHDVSFVSGLDELKELELLNDNDKPFDLLVMARALHCMTEQDERLEALETAFRLLEAGGQLVLCDEPVKGLFEKGFLNTGFKKSETQMGVLDYTKLCKQAGFQSLQSFFPQLAEQALINEQALADKTIKRGLEKLPFKKGIGFLLQIDILREPLKAFLLRPLQHGFAVAFTECFEKRAMQKEGLA